MIISLGPITLIFVVTFIIPSAALFTPPRSGLILPIYTGLVNICAIEDLPHNSVLFGLNPKSCNLSQIVWIPNPFM